MIRWHSFTLYLKKRFGQRVQKIPLDAGSGCPNRDGTLSCKGCTFCNASGSGSGLGLAGMNLPTQWKFWREHFLTSGKAKLFLAYFQSFSNTYGSPARLAELLQALQPLPDIAGFSVGTRPDCLDAEKIRILAAAPWSEKWLELGIQTFNNITLARINRGHDAATSVQALDLTDRYGQGKLHICAHLMLGLPGEGRKEMLETARILNTLPVQGVKLHNVYICKNTALAEEFYSGRYKPLAREEYVDLAAEILANLRSDILVHRVVADPAPGELVAPEWATDKSGLVREIEHRYHKKMTAISQIFPDGQKH